MTQEFQSTKEFTVGDLIDDDDAGLGYITKLTLLERLEPYSILIHIKWFAHSVDQIYRERDVDRWITNRVATHHPVGKQ